MYSITNKSLTHYIKIKLYYAACYALAFTCHHICIPNNTNLTDTHRALIHKTVIAHQVLPEAIIRKAFKPLYYTIQH
jgi:hypothetical protein